MFELSWGHCCISLSNLQHTFLCLSLHYEGHRNVLQINKVKKKEKKVHWGSASHWHQPKSSLSFACIESSFAHSYCICRFLHFSFYYSFPLILNVYVFTAAAAALPSPHVSGNHLRDCHREPASFSFTSFQGVFFQGARNQFTAQPLDKAAVINLPHRLFSALCTLALCHSHSFAISWALFYEINKQARPLVLIIDSSQLSCSCWPPRWNLTSCFHCVGASPYTPLKNVFNLIYHIFCLFSSISLIFLCIVIVVIIFFFTELAHRY